MQHEATPKPVSASGMLRALIWKEWRGLRTIWIVCAIAACAACVVGWMWDNWLLGWGALALAGMLIGAQLFAGEKANGTAALSARLPVSRRQIWLARMIMAHVAWGLLVVVIVVWRLSPQEQGDFFTRNVHWVIIFPASWLCLAIGTLCGALLDRPVTAVGAALALAVMLGVSVEVGLLQNTALKEYLWELFDPGISLLICAVVLTIGACAAIAFALSYFICVRRW